MMNRLLVLVLGLGLLAVPSCDLDVPDLNNPSIDRLQVDPTPASVNAASIGLLVGQRGGKSTTTGLVNQLGILGRESYDFDPNDGRFVTELLQGNLQRGSPFGGQFWAGPFNNIRLGYLTIDALDKIDPMLMDDDSKTAMRGFAHTIMAADFLTIVLTHNDTGAPIDVNRKPGSPDLAPFVPKAKVYEEINRLLDLGLSELRMTYDTTDPTSNGAFTFSLGTGYAGFNTPRTFARVNRAIKARVLAYLASPLPTATQADKDKKTAAYQGVLTALVGPPPSTPPPDSPPTTSFLNDSAGFSFTNGPFYPFSANTGDVTNGIGSGRRPIFAHPSLKTDAQLQPPPDPTKPDVRPLDARYTGKIRNFNVNPPVNDPSGTTPADPKLSSTIKFTAYTATASLPFIRNEELILLKAEALWFTGQHDAAVTELNIVRTGSGKLAALAVPTTFTTDDQFIDALLLERRYSLMFEGGHRWIDLLRFGRSILTNDEDPGSHVANIRFPVPQAECDARPGEPACNITSSQVIP
jgi:hypothetical protein